MINGYDVQTLQMIAEAGGLEGVYARGYNDAKREIAMSGEYERANHRGREDTVKAVLEIIDTAQTYKMYPGEEDTYIDKSVIRDAVEALKGGAE